MASTLPETLNVSRFFNRKEFSNTVEIIVNETKFVCSGVVIAQQSPVFEKLFGGGASFVLLEDFFFPGAEIVVEECLMLLYGGNVMVTIKNVESLTRFSIFYEVKFMYDLAFGWVKQNISPQNVSTLFDIANLPEVKNRKGDFMAFCLEFMKNKEIDVSQEMVERIGAKKPIVGDFIQAMIKLTNCPAYITFLVEYCGVSEDNTNFILDLAEHINFENLYVEYKDIFNNLMIAMKAHMESPKRLKHLLEIQMSVLKL